MESPSNTTILAAGTKCAATQCGLHDYLPYKCQFCSESFCSSHFRPAAHHCEKAVSLDRVAPPCPLCSIPVTIPQGEDPNTAMEKHFDTACEVMGKKKNDTPRCARHKCQKVLYSPIRCDSCKELFCATHRHPDTHRCVSSMSTANPRYKANPSSSQSTPSAGDKFAAFIKSNVPSTSSPSPSPQRKVQPTKPAVAVSSAGPSSGKAAVAPAKAAGASSSTTPSLPNPFSKVDRRAKAESESRRKALQERAKKGLLSEKEKEMLAQEEALLAQVQAAGSKKDCVVM